MSNANTKAKRLLTSFLRKIAEEKTEFCVDGEDEMVTKAEALARLVWRMALGYKAEVQIIGEGIKEIEHKPDRGMMSILFDRIEGRTVPATEVGGEKKTVADKVSEQGADRIAKAGNVDDN